MGLNMKKKLPEFNLIAVVGLLLIPIFLLGWLFVNESNKSIAFARQELLGTAFLEKFMPIYAKLAVEEPITAEDRKRVAELQTQFGRKLNISPEIAKLDSVFNPSNFDSAFALKTSRQLISIVGDKSNLILDPDLDSYYLMDSTILRIPELLNIASELTNPLRSFSITSIPMSDNELYLLHAGQFQETLSGLRYSLQSAISGNKNGKLKLRISNASAVYQAQAHEFTGALDANKNSLLVHTDATKMQMKSFARNTIEFWQGATSELNQLLQHRINILQNWLYMGVGISIVLTLAAISCAIAVFKKLIHRLDDKIVFLAHHDPMTRLMNRSAFNAAMTQALAEANNTGEKIALHLVDLDKFKAINDNFGHHVGDAVLKVLADRLLENSRPSDLIGRLGGDEFVLLQRNISSDEKADAFSKRLVRAMQTPIEIENQVLKTSISVGVAVCPTHGTDDAKLMVHADMALYAAKAAGRNQAMMFNSTLEEEIKLRRLLETEIKHAADESLFTLNYQAQYNSSGTEIRGFEALLRLRGRTGENISPKVFIPIAEQLGLINKIGAWVIEQACQTATAWPDKIGIAVNLSPLQFSAGGIAKIIAEALHKTGLKPSRLEVEITEGLLMQNTEEVLTELKAIRALGVSIAMDDFGAGYSSLSYLWRFPFDKIKIDRSFVKALEENETNAKSVLRTIVVLGHSLEMIVTAEGVETDAQADFIRELNCDQIQGFLYSRPIPEQELPALILKNFLKVSDTEKKPRKKLQLVS
jgi:diguanylate cyclase (GGDEF)-like protein